MPARIAVPSETTVTLPLLRRLPYPRVRMAGRSPALEEQPRDVADDRRFAAAADAEVADADHRARQPRSARRHARSHRRRQTATALYIELRA